MRLDHRIVALGGYRVPAPFRSLAVRSEEPRHAFDARAPYGQVHVVRCGFLSPDARASLAADGYARVDIAQPCDVDYAATTFGDLAAVAPDLTDLAGHLAGALQCTGVLGDDPAAYRRSVATRIDYLAARGAGFHNDVRGHWSACLFWILAIDLADVAFVLPHAGLQLALAPGDLLVFDPCLAHGLCRPADGGQVLESSFPPEGDGRQLFLTGEIALDDARWAALAAPWLPVEEHARRGALDLAVAEFDERGGAVRRPRALRDAMKRSSCLVETSPACDAGDGASPSAQ